MSSTAQYYTIENDVPPPRGKGLIDTMNNLRDGQSFVVPNKLERMRAIGLARSRKIKLVTQKLKDGSDGYRVWRLAPQEGVNVSLN